jgi:hypothetical protein
VECRHQKAGDTIGPMYVRCSRLKVTYSTVYCSVCTWSHSSSGYTRSHSYISKRSNFDFGFTNHAKRPSRFGCEPRSSLSKTTSTRSGTVLRRHRGTSMYKKAMCLIVYWHFLHKITVSPGLYSIFLTSRSRCVRLARWLCRKIACQTIYVPSIRVARIVRQLLTSSELCPLLLPSLNLHRTLTGHRPSHSFYHLNQGTAVPSVSPSERSAGSSSASTEKSHILKRLLG